MEKGESASRKLTGQILLGGVGVVLAAAGAWGYFGGQNDKIAGGFFVLAGLVSVVLAAFYSHVEEMVDLGLLKIPLVRARRAEKQVARGQVIAANDLEEAGKALEEALARYTVSADAASASSESTRTVLLVEGAILTIATLTADEQVLVRTEVARMSRDDFQPDLDLRETRPGNAGHSYRMHRLPESDIRLWYRQKSDSEPQTLYVVVIERTDEDYVGPTGFQRRLSAAFDAIAKKL